jgi:hypothetical protein
MLDDLFFKVGFMTQQTKELELLKQLVGVWTVGIAMKTSDENLVSGCGDMIAVEIADLGVNSEIETQIEGYEDYYENDMWSFDRASGKVHLFAITSEGDARDHVGTWKDEETLELHWRGTFEDQELEELILVKWLSKDQFELKEIVFSFGKINLTTNYVFKRK